MLPSSASSAADTNELEDLMSPRPVYFDCDTGIDDALALAYLATFSDAELLGAIGTYGNVATDTAVRNTAYVLELLELHDVPVMRGLAV